MWLTDSRFSLRVPNGLALNVLAAELERVGFRVTVVSANTIEFRGNWFAPRSGPEWIARIVARGDLHLAASVHGEGADCTVVANLWQQMLASTALLAVFAAVVSYVDAGSAQAVKVMVAAALVIHVIAIRIQAKAALTQLIVGVAGK